MAMKQNTAQPWIYSPKIDLMFILGPAFLVTMLAIVLQGQMEKLGAMPAWLWLLLIVGVDVSHVYSTLFRTYLDREELRKRQTIYLLTPLLAWVAGCLLYSAGNMIFWRVLAYLAVFHFVRQQYGFMMIYGRKDAPAYKLIDKLAIYAATIYPLIYWHCQERNFVWFVDGDFFQFQSEAVINISGLAYGAILAAYGIKEWLLWRKSRQINWPRNLMLMGTALSWTFGIIIFDNDLAFSAINVISHGVPYLALIWIYGSNQSVLQGDKATYYFSWVGNIFQRKWVFLYLGALFLWAYFEESLWDGLIWREHGGVLFLADALAEIQSEQTLVWLVPLLAMPQITHYLLDAYIWRMQQPDTNWKEILFLKAR